MSAKRNATAGNGGAPEDQMTGRSAVVHSTAWARADVAAERHAAYVAALDCPDMALIERLAEQRAHEILHERAAEMLGLARREALTKGPCWAALVMAEDEVSA